MPAISSDPVVSSRSASVLGDAHTIPQSTIIGIVIAPIVFFLLIGIFLTWLLCFYRERDETCWLLKLCCGRKDKPKTLTRSFRLGGGYSSNAGAGYSRTISATAPPHGLGISVREGDDLRNGFQYTRASSQLGGKDSPELDTTFVGGNEDGYELDYLPPRRPPPSSFRLFPGNQSPTSSRSLAEASPYWPELPPRPAPSRLRKTKERTSVLFSSSGGGMTLRRDSV